MGKPPKDDNIGIITMGCLLWLRDTKSSRDMTSGFGQAGHPRMGRFFTHRGENTLVNDILHFFNYTKLIDDIMSLQMLPHLNVALL